MRRLVLLSAIVMAVAGPALAQDTLPPWLGGLTSSLGQPPRRHGYASVGLGFDGCRGAQFEPDPIIVGGLGITKDLSNPVTSVLAGSVETFLSARGTVVDGGARVLRQYRAPALRRNRIPRPGRSSGAVLWSDDARAPRRRLWRRDAASRRICPSRQGYRPAQRARPDRAAASRSHSTSQR